MYLIDTHAHLYDPDYDEDREEIIQRALQAGVQQILLADVEASRRELMAKMIADYPEICSQMVGLHPTVISEKPDEWRNELAQVVELVRSSAANYCAIGETGMDLYWDKTYIAEQQEAFRTQLDLAIEFNMPIALHVRDAWESTLEILESYPKGSFRGVVHAYSGTVEDYLRVREMGDLCVGIGGVVTFKKAALAETIKSIDIEHIVLETDAPYLTPTPHRGTRNESSYIPLIASKIAELKGLAIEQVAEQTTANARRVFGLK